MRLVVDILNILILCFVVFIYGVAYGKIRFGRLQSAQRKSGKWIDGKCDQCGCHAPYWSMATTYYKSNYCPECGADMREGEQE